MPNAPRPTVDIDAVRTHVNTALDKRTRYAVWTAIHDALVLAHGVSLVLQPLADLHFLDRFANFGYSEFNAHGF